MCRAMKPKLYSPLGYRVAVEYRHKPLNSSHRVSDVFHPLIADWQNISHHTLHKEQFILVDRVVHVRIEPRCNVPT